MQKIDLFERLEVANAQIDIWIDEEEYDKVIDSCKINPQLKIDLERAFTSETCTAAKDTEWLAILSNINQPIVAILNIPLQENGRIEIVSPDYDTWSRFFWAKLIRARIQQKGTDCYYRRLDQVVAYLERHCPPIQPLKQEKNHEHQEALFSNMLAVIYLLEMAASGEAADQRSFAERARRILRENGENTLTAKYFEFYDLLARYNIGVGYFHERAYRKAVLEFNWIIREIGHTWDKKGNFNPCSGTLGASIHKRLGRNLLYLPAVLYRAEIQLKLQLAYHAYRTIFEYLDDFEGYKLAHANLIKAEAYQQMGRRDQAWQALWQVFKSAHDGSGDLGFRKHVRSFSAKPGEKLANIKGRLQNLVIAEHLEYLKDFWYEMPDMALKQHLKYLNKFFEEYKLSIEFQKENRKGYFEQIAEYIALLSEKAGEKSKEAAKSERILESEAKGVFATNRTGILFSEEALCDCLCEEKGIDLRRLDPEHYDAFSGNLRKFFKEFVKKDRSLKCDQRDFLERLKSLEKKSGENLAWRIRKLDFETAEDPFQESWCSRDCFSEGSSSWKSAFGSLLECADTSVKEKNNKKNLSARDYEQIMNHWDDHFLEHMKDASFHEPRCRAIHFLGLQRWNSASPAQGRSLGGGYLLYHTDKNGRIDLGVAIDPGFDFVRNLFHVGFSLADIDVVLLSHAHVDHVRDFESMVSLLLELRKRTKNSNQEIKRKMHAIMTLGVYRRLEYLIESPGLREFIEPYIVDIEKEIRPKGFLFSFIFIQEEDEKKRGKDQNRFRALLSGEETNNEMCLKIIPTKAYHNDFSEYSDSFGFVINIKDPISEPEINYTFGYTGDTSWNGDIIKQYIHCDSLLVHIGSLIDREKKKSFSYYEKGGEKCFDLIRHKNHPYLMGMLHFLTEIVGWKHGGKNPLVLMSEFGEELRGRIRLDLIERLKRAYDEAFYVLPVDIGLDVLLAFDLSKCNDHFASDLTNNRRRVWCVQCNHFVPLDKADFEHYGHDEALFCVCKTCKKATPHNVLQERLHTLYEVGRRLQTH